MRYMIINKADENSEAGQFPVPEVIQGVGALIDDMTKAGVLLFAEGVHRSAIGARVKVSGGKRTVTDQGHHMPVAVPGQLEGLGQSVGVGQGRAGVAGLDPVVLALGARRIPRQTVLHAQRVEILASSGAT